MEILRHLEGKRLGIWKPEKVKELLMVTDRQLYRIDDDLWMVTDRQLYRIDDYYDGLWIDTIGHGFCRRRREEEKARLTSRLLIKTLPAPAPPFLWYQPTLYFSYSSIIRERFHFAIEKGLSVGLREDVFLMLSSVATVQKFRPFRVKTLFLLFRKISWRIVTTCEGKTLCFLYFPIGSLVSCVLLELTAPPLRIETRTSLSVWLSHFWLQNTPFRLVKETIKEKFVRKGLWSQRHAQIFGEYCRCLKSGIDYLQVCDKGPPYISVRAEDRKWNDAEKSMKADLERLQKQTLRPGAADSEAGLKFLLGSPFLGYTIDEQGLKDERTCTPQLSMSVTIHHTEGMWFTEL
jgi:hypothetical protein